MAHDADIREHVQLALSHREKARKLQQESAEEWSAGRISNDRYEKLSRFYAEHRKLAEKDLAYWREEAAAQADQVKNQYSQLARDAQRLALDEKAKRMDPAQYAGQRTRIDSQMVGHQAAIAALGEVLVAEDSGSLGGFVDLPLERYRGGRGAPSLEARSGWRWTWETVVLLLAGLLIGFALLSLLLLFTDSEWSLWGRRSPRLECAFAFGDADEKSLAIECRNLGGRPIELYFSWPDGLPPLSRRNDRTVGGIAVLVRELGETEFEPRPIPADWWLGNGRPLNAGEPLVVEPLLTVRLELDTAMVRSIGRGVEAIRLEVTRGDGIIFDTFEVAFSEPSPVTSARPSLEHGAEVRPGAAVPMAPAPALAPPPVEDLAPEAADLEPSDVVPEERAEEPLEPAVFAYVSFVGRVGERAALAVQLAGELRSRRVMLEAGDELGGGWMVDDMEGGTEQMLVLVHPSTGRREWVRKGAPEPARLTLPEN